MHSGGGPPPKVLALSAFYRSFGASYSRRFPQTPSLAPSRFRTPSTPCSPIDLPSLFHLGPALRVQLFKVLSPHQQRTPFLGLDVRSPHGLQHSRSHDRTVPPGSYPLMRSRPFREVIHLADPAIPFLSFSPSRPLAPDSNHPC